MDKRQSRRVNNNSFAVAISEWKRTQLQQHPSPENRVEGDARFDGRMARQVSPAPRARPAPTASSLLTCSRSRAWPRRVGPRLSP